MLCTLDSGWNCAIFLALFGVDSDPTLDTDTMASTSKIHL